MAFTVCPLHRLHGLPPEIRIPFGDDFELRELPQWIKSESMIKNMSWVDQQVLAQDRYALCSDYEASAMGELDPSATPDEIRSFRIESSPRCCLRTSPSGLRGPQRYVSPTFSADFIGVKVNQTASHTANRASRTSSVSPRCIATQLTKTTQCLLSKQLRLADCILFF
jgi:hypothetical protein